MTGVLLKAVSAGRPRQVRLLLDSGISLETRDECGQTALIRAVFIEHQRNREKILRMLLKYGAMVSKVDLVGRNSLSWSCLYGQAKEVRLLLDAADVDLDINQTDIQGQTSLYHAATSGSAAAVKLIVDELVKYGLSVDVANAFGVTPLMQALKLGHDVCASILVKQGGATVGLPPGGVDDVNSVDDWLDRHVNHAQGAPDMISQPCDRKTLLHAPGRQYKDECSKTQFPPILSPRISKKIRYQETRASIALSQAPPSHETDSTYGSESAAHNSANSHAMDELPQGGIRGRPGTPVSIRSLSMTSSTEANADSSDDEVDDFSTPVKEKRFQPGTDLHMLYRIFEEQNTVSYRPGAAKHKISSDSCLESSDLSSDAGEYHSKGTPRKASVYNRKLMMMRKSVPRVILPVKLPVPLDGGGSSSESDTEKLFQMAKKTLLPKISQRKAHLKPQPTDYSCV